MARLRNFNELIYIKYLKHHVSLNNADFYDGGGRGWHIVDVTLIHSTVSRCEREYEVASERFTDSPRRGRLRPFLCRPPPQPQPLQLSGGPGWPLRQSTKPECPIPTFLSLDNLPYARPLFVPAPSFHWPSGFFVSWGAPLPLVDRAADRVVGAAPPRARPFSHPPPARRWGTRPPAPPRECMRRSATICCGRGAQRAPAAGTNCRDRQ